MFYKIGPRLNDWPSWARDVHFKFLLICQNCQQESESSDMEEVFSHVAGNIESVPVFCKDRKHSLLKDFRKMAVGGKQN